MVKIKLLFLFLLLIISIGVLFYYAPIYPKSYANDSTSDNEVDDSSHIHIEPEIENNKNVEPNKPLQKIKKVQLIKYWANWCGICKKIQPNWENAKNLIKMKYPNVEVIDVNCDNATKGKCFTYSNGIEKPLEGVPTIVIRKNKHDIEYKKDSLNGFRGDRSVDELVKFVEINK